MIEKTIKELNEWFNSPNAEDHFYQIPSRKINDMSDEKNIRKSILIGYETLNNWYSNHFVYNSLTKSDNEQYRIKTALNSYHIISLVEALSKIYPNNPPNIMFDFSTYFLANNIIIGWEKETKSMITFLNEALGTKVLDGGLNFKITSWFILEIADKGFNIDYDYSEFNYPENMGVYKKALNNWNTKDLKLVDEIVSELCTFHIFQASHGSLSESAGKSDPMFLQFSHLAWYVYAFEILSWLAMRKKQGFNNPDKFSHPLMQLPINQLPESKIKFQSDALFDKILNKIKV